MPTNRVYPLKEIPKVDGSAGCSIVEYTNDDCIPQGVIADGDISTAKIADLAVTNDKLANDAVNRNKIADSSVFTEQVGVNAIAHRHIRTDQIGVENLVFESGTNESEDRILVIGGDVSIPNPLPGGTTTSAVGFKTIPMSTATGGLTSVTSDDTLTGDGTSGDALGISDAVRNQLLLINGFLLLTRTTASDVGTRQAWVGMLPGFDTTQQTYFFDTSDTSWYAVGSGGTALIGF